MKRERETEKRHYTMESIRIVYSAMCDNFISFVKNEEMQRFRNAITLVNESIRRSETIVPQFIFFLCRAQLQLRTNYRTGKTRTAICLYCNAEIRLYQIELFLRRT